MLRSAHRECEQRYDDAIKKIRGFFTATLTSTMDAKAFSDGIRSISEAAKVPQNEFEPLILDGFGALIERALDDHVLSEAEEERIVVLRDAFEIAPARFQESGLQQRLVKGAILRDLQEGSPRNRLTISGGVPFLLRKSEELVWVFQDVPYHTMKERVQYVGGSTGVSVRVARGVYLRTGGYKGERVSTQSLELQDVGLLGITTKHLYFKGLHKGFRIALSKLVSIERFSDGIGILKDGANPKPQIFAVDDPWFAANLLAQL